MLKITTNKILIACLVLLNIISLTSLYSSLHQGGEFKYKNIFYRQIFWILIFWITICIFSFINYRFYFDAGFLLYGLSVILLIAVKLFGKEIMGAQRWFSFFGINFQPSEFSKLAIVLVLARIFSDETDSSYPFLSKVLFPLLIVLISSFLVFKQPDLGTAAILFLLFFTMGLSSKIKKKYFVGLLIAGIILSPLAWHFLKDYQKKRIAVFINPNVDPLGTGYTIIQSKIAIGSGGFAGKGFLSGTQNQFNFLPERHTDFIFTVIAEEFGFLGGLLLIFIYFLILRVIYKKIEHIKDNFAQFLCVGIYSIFFLHVFINIGMTMGFVPVVGLPLLLLSYGGTHLIITAIFIGIFLNISRQW